MSKVYHESAQDVPVYAECDILVVGSGCAGHSAAIAAARAGAKNIILMERYGYSGGDVTGGYVIMVPKLSWFEKQYVRGIQEEWFTRLDKYAPGSVLGVSEANCGSTDPALIAGWGRIHDATPMFGPKYLVRSPYFEPNQLKIEMDKMLLEHRDAIKALYHSWGVKPIMEGNAVKGVLFESKEGRRAVMAKSVIDATGDGDIFRYTGTPFKALADSKTRSNTTALVWRIGGCNQALYWEWTKTNPQGYQAIRENLGKIAGFRCLPLASERNDVMWINNWHANLDCAKIEDITKTEIETRDTMRNVLEYLKEAVPVAFEKAFIYDIAPQLGSRCSYRLQGEYIMTSNDFAFIPQQEDVIAWHSTISRINDSGPVEIPYRSILPQGVENMLCPGRHLSADDVAIDWLNLIPQCIGTGQGAGVAAAVAVLDGTSVRNVNIKKVQDILAGEQDVPLPRNSHTDKSYTECGEAHEWGMYSDLAKKAREEADGLKEYRQW
jgi:hypothetical protein